MPRTAQRKSASKQERRVVTPNPNLVVITVGTRAKKADVLPKEKASAVLAKIGKLISKPGIDRDSVFESPLGKPVYAYSAYTADPTKIVREDRAGVKVVGQVVGGRFRPIKAR